MGSHNTIFTTAIHRMQIQKGGEKRYITYKKASLQNKIFIPHAVYLLS